MILNINIKYGTINDFDILLSCISIISFCVDEDPKSNLRIILEIQTILQTKLQTVDVVSDYW